MTPIQISRTTLYALVGAESDRDGANAVGMSIEAPRGTKAGRKP